MKRLDSDFLELIEDRYLDTITHNDRVELVCTYYFPPKVLFEVFSHFPGGPGHAKYNTAVKRLVRLWRLRG
jgi:hypothetical protein